jgi:hypothetical protein
MSLSLPFVVSGDATPLAAAETAAIVLRLGNMLVTARERAIWSIHNSFSPMLCDTYGYCRIAAQST